jgi:hypothetical protein
MARYDGVDLKLSEDGDLVFEHGDIALVRKQEFVAQSSRNRIKTSDPDWYDYKIDNIGANLEDLLGMPNNPDTARLGIDKIREALTSDGLIDGEDVYIRPVPIGRYVIGFFVFIRTEYDGQPLQFEILLNLESGVIIKDGIT